MLISKLDLNLAYAFDLHAPKVGLTPFPSGTALHAATAGLAPWGIS